MATFDAPYYPEAFMNMENQRKTVYALVATGEYDFMSAGDRLEFGEHASITVGMVRRYPNLEKVVEVEGWQSLLPDAASAEEAITMVRSEGDWDVEAEHEKGVMALRVREARRKG